MNNRLLIVLLYPFALLYSLGSEIRNYLFRIGYWKRFEFGVTTISVGNLTVGGTGKTPMIEYLIRLLKNKKIVTLSRGYKRKTKGFRLATRAEDNAETLGDEPAQFFEKFQDIHVAVGEERAIAIPFILAELPDTACILLDDAYQHLTVKPKLNILLSDYNRPFYNDYVLPAGLLRERRKHADRADIIVTTKCPDELLVQEINEIEQNIKRYNSNALLAFSKIVYAQPINKTGNSTLERVVSFSGLANDAPFVAELNANYQLLNHHRFKDHHDFTDDELKTLASEAKQKNAVLLTTEKDYMRIKDRIQLLEGVDLFVLPIHIEFIKAGNEFDAQILNALEASL